MLGTLMLYVATVGLLAPGLSANKRVDSINSHDSKYYEDYVMSNCCILVSFGETSVL